MHTLNSNRNLTFVTLWKCISVWGIFYGYVRFYSSVITVSIPHYFGGGEDPAVAVNPLPLLMYLIYWNCNSRNALFETKNNIPSLLKLYEGLRKRVSKFWAFHVTSSSAWQNMTNKTQHLGPIRLRLSPRPGALSCVQEIRCIRHLHQLWWSNVNFLQIILRVSEI